MSSDRVLPLAVPFARTFPRVLVLLGLALPAGCEAPPLDYLEVKRVDEPVTEAELATFLRIIDSLPERRLPPMSPVFAPAPRWNASRTLPVSDLVREEGNLLEQHWDITSLASELERVKPLQRALARERMTTEQFVGLTLALGAALSRSAVRENQDLRRMVRAGGVEVDKLKEDGRSFSSLTDDTRYAVLLRALWITRHDRAQRLLRVPEPNVELVQRHRERLAPIFPAEFVGNPFDGLADLLAEKGVPFEELPESGSDEEIEWRRSEAIVGTDRPD